MTTGYTEIIIINMKVDWLQGSGLGFQEGDVDSWGPDGFVGERLMLERHNAEMLGVRRCMVSFGGGFSYSP